jgi:hypothetical protein
MFDGVVESSCLGQTDYTVFRGAVRRLTRDAFDAGA